MTTFPTLAIVTPHTHWDREWYRTRHEFGVRLVEVIDRVLDLLDSDPAFTHFMLDGQTIVLDDYLAVRPENEARLREHVSAGRLAIGPWYVLADEFIVGPESHVRLRDGRTNHHLDHWTGEGWGILCSSPFGLLDLASELAQLIIERSDLGS